jgi:hypothetical protein
VFSSPPSSHWQWFAIIISIIAFGLAIMTLPTVFQMIWGRPKLKVSFWGKGHILQCGIQNVPVKGILKYLGVERELIPDFSVNVLIKDKSIEDELDGQVYYGSCVLEVGDLDKSCKKQVILPASDTLFARIYIVTATNEKAYLMDENFDPIKPTTLNWGKEIKPGTYKLTIEANAKGKISNIAKEFKYQTSEPCLEWVDDSGSKKKKLWLWLFTRGY